LWLDRRKESARGVVGVVLNSPWLDLQGSKTLRGPVTQMLRVLGKVRPFQQINLRPGVYGQTLHVGGTGEWEYDLQMKPLAGFPVTFGWLNAIRRAHARLHHGIETGVPTLVLRSNRSLFIPRYTEACDRADLVLDTTQIAQWASSLGSQVTDAPIDDARHDVFLSIPQARASAYAALDNWLTQASLA
jgi:alpha-beta hydrolase superfamily lysophospholipase